MDWATARGYAEEIMAVLAPACVRMEVAGSVRRGERNGFHELDLVVIPRPFQPVFGQKPGAHALVTLTDQLRAQGHLIPSRDSKGRTSWGDRNRRAVWCRETERLAESVPLDLFMVTRETWGAQLAIRTGDREFSHMLVTPAPSGAMPPGMRLQDGRLRRGEQVLDTPEEPDFFAALELPLLPPYERTRRRLEAVIAERREARRVARG